MSIEASRIGEYYKLLALLAVFSSVAYISSSLYGEYMIAYFSSFIVDEYTYMYILFPLSLIVSLYIIHKYFVLSPPSIDRVLVFIVLFIGSILFYSISGLRNEYMVQYSGLAFILLIWSFIVLVYRPISVKYYVFLIVLMLSMIPLPISIISFFSAHLSVIMGRIAAYISGVDYVVRGNRVLLGLVDADGKYRYFEVSYACSGIVSLTSVLSVLPIIVYMVMRVVDTVIGKLVKTLFMIAVSTSIALLGNLARLLLIIHVARSIGYEEAMGIFHQSPSAIYVSLSVFASFYLLFRFFPVKLRERDRETARIHYVDKNAIALVLVALIALSTIYISLGRELSSEVLVKYTPFIPSLKVFLNNPALIIFNKTPVHVAKNIPVPALIPLLGTSIVQEIIVKYRGLYYVGYVEVAESPARFHGWHVCLTFQGYIILRTWSITGNTTINYILVEKGNRLMLLGYTIYRIPLSIGNKTTTSYVRISLFARITGRDIALASRTLKEIFESPLSGYSRPTSRTGGLFEKIVLIENILVVLNLALIIFLLCSRYFRRVIEYFKTMI